MNYDCRTMGERISHRRQALHIKQNILAEKLNISKAIPHRKVGAILPEVI